MNCVPHNHQVEFLCRSPECTMSSAICYKAECRNYYHKHKASHIVFVHDINDKLQDNNKFIEFVNKYKSIMEMINEITVLVEQGYQKFISRNRIHQSFVKVSKKNINLVTGAELNIFLTTDLSDLSSQFDKKIHKYDQFISALTPLLDQKQSNPTLQQIASQVKIKTSRLTKADTIVNLATSRDFQHPKEYLYQSTVSTQIFNEVMRRVRYSGGKASYINQLSLDGINLIRLTKEIAFNLQKCSSLEMLSMNSCNLISLENFPKFSHLYSLSLTDNKITDNEIKHILILSHLEQLFLDKNGIKYFQTLREISQKMKKLTRLKLVRNPISKSNDYRQRICEIFPNLEILDDKNLFLSSH